MRNVSSWIVLAALTVMFTGSVALAETGETDLSQYFLENPELAQQQRLAVHYDTHEREAFWIRGQTYELMFEMAGSPVGLATYRAGEGRASLVEPGGLNVVAVSADGTQHETALAEEPARINIFRHGPHYYDVHVYDLELADGEGEALPVRGELVFHAYPTKLYYELKLHAVGDAEIEEAFIELPVAGEATAMRGRAGESEAADGPFWVTDLEGSPWVGATVEQQGAVALMTPAPEGTERIGVQESENGQRRFVQQIALGGESPNPSTWAEDDTIVAHGRLLIDDEVDGWGEALAGEATLETETLTAEHIQVGGEGQFEGYDARRGYYTISTPAGMSLNWYYDNPHFMPVAPLSIRNDDRERHIYIRHEDRDYDGRVESGVVTDAEGFMVPLLVQNSKNFTGEHEEPFYDPGDPSYSESYYPLLLEPGQELELRSYHAKYNWGKHPLKQIGSLQAWMPYYQMSLGVTETTCWVPFRFGGHNGIWMADLRGLSGEMWESQPQFDNVGGHRLMHYMTGDGQAEHFPVYQASWFRSTGPNMAHLLMEYVSDDGAARLDMTSWEPPQVDETRNFLRMEITFEEPVTIQNPAQNLRLISLGTTTQTLRYESLGFTDVDGQWEERRADTTDDFPVGAELTTESPAVALYHCTQESGSAGNNAMIVTGFEGTASGEALEQLAFSVVPKPNGNLMAFLTLPGDEVSFEAGDTLTLDLVVMPYGTVGTDHRPVLDERERWGLNPVRVTAERGTVRDDWPATVRTEGGQAEFTVEGGHDNLAILVEGFDSHVPPELEVRRNGRWEPVAMTVDETDTGNEGHQSYLTDEEDFGFVFVIDSDGSAMEFRVEE